MIEGDSLQVIQAITDSRLVQTLYGHTIDEIRFLSSSVNCSFLHVNRKANKLALALAREQFYLQILMCGWKNFHRIWMM